MFYAIQRGTGTDLQLLEQAGLLRFQPLLVTLLLLSLQLVDDGLAFAQLLLQSADAALDVTLIRGWF